jgi:hypothetical protein
MRPDECSNRRTRAHVDKLGPFWAFEIEGHSDLADGSVPEIFRISFAVGRSRLTRVAAIGEKRTSNFANVTFSSSNG